MGNMFGNGNAMSAENKCAIHTSFSSNSSWQYDWSEDQDCNACFNDATLDECGVCEGSGPDQHFTCDGTFKPETKDALQVAVDLWTCTRFEKIIIALSTIYIKLGCFINYRYVKRISIIKQHLMMI